MPATFHVATINAFPNKFGTFTGAILNKETNTVERERFDTFDGARNWCRTRAWEVLGPVTFASMPRKGEYLANVWQDAAVAA